VTTQLSDYAIAPGRLEDFVAAWHDGVLPLRRRYGFDVRAWRVVGADRFVWLLSLPGSSAEFEARDAEYYASPERAALRPDPAQWIVRAEQAWLASVTG
jgi:hypothetical protein